MKSDWRHAAGSNRSMMLVFLATLTAGSTYDLAVYGSSGAAPIAAIAASRSGAKKVVLLTQTSHVGGMLTGGLQHTDAGNGKSVQGLTREFFIRTEEQYPGRPTNASYPPGHSPPGWLFESHVGERVLLEMLAEANVTTVYSVGGVTAVTRGGGSSSSSSLAVESVTFESGVTATATLWIDASYEGGITEQVATMTWGRESKAHYNEDAAGRQDLKSIGVTISPYWDVNAVPYDVPSNVIPHVSPAIPVAIGESDRWAEPFDFRLCFTKSPSHQRHFTKPANYNASEFEYWRRFYALQPPKSLSSAGLNCIGPIPNTYKDCPKTGGSCKCDMLGMNHGTDDTDGSWAYLNASNAERKRVWQKHLDFTQGLLWFWSTDPAVPEAVRKEMTTYGHCTDEYDNDTRTEFGITVPPHWPHQLYVREGKRLVGDWVWTEHLPNASKVNRTIGLGSYNFDSHYVSRIISRTGNASTDSIMKEGRVKVAKQMPAGDDPHPSPGALNFGCVTFGTSKHSRCVAGMPAGSIAGNGSDATCGGKCTALGPHEWLAVKRLSKYADDNKTLVVTLPGSQTTSWLKKSKALANTLPPALKLAITQGERISLQEAPAGIDETYDFINAAAVAAQNDEQGGCGVCMDKPFTMPFDTMVPKTSEVSNLLVPVAISATHVRYNAIRMAPSWMILGHAAGAAAAQLLARGAQNVAEVDVRALQATLVKQKQLLVWTTA